jgi:hypothetical protein
MSLPVTATQPGQVPTTPATCPPTAPHHHRNSASTAPPPALCSGESIVTTPGGRLPPGFATLPRCRPLALPSAPVAALRPASAARQPVASQPCTNAALPAATTPSTVHPPQEALAVGPATRAGHEPHRTPPPTQHVRTFFTGIESLVVTVAAALHSGASAGAEAGDCTGSTIPSCADHRGGKGHRDKCDEYHAGAVAGRLGVNRCGGPLTRRPHVRRGFHGDRGEAEHAAVTTVTR